MNVKVKFLGAAQTVTGSKYLLEIDDFRLLVDCGLFQGVSELRRRNWDKLPVAASSIDAILLTHAHIDHSGYLPKLASEGYSGPVYCTEATGDLLQIMLMDAAKLQEEEADWAKRKKYSSHPYPKPLFTTEDARKALSLLVTHPYHQEFAVAANMRATFSNAGHILGSAIVSLLVEGTNQEKKIVFSGDLGPENHPLLSPCEIIDSADILFIESTYGDRETKAVNAQAELATIINQTIERKGCVLIPSFAVGRTQSLIYHLRSLFKADEIPDIPVYIDSPMAISATGFYKKHHQYHKLDEQSSSDIFDFKHFHYCQPQEASISLNQIKKDAIIISASGMCSGGRILHHLFHRLPRYHDTLLFVGYQAEGTRGRKILEGDEEVRIFGLEVPVRCQVRQIDGLSAHADKKEMLQWLSHFADPPKKTFIIHGEPLSSYHFARSIRQLGWSNVIVPEYLQSFLLFDHI